MTLVPRTEITEHALAVLGTFLPDYTHPDDEGHCARLIVVGGSLSDGFFDVRLARQGISPVFRVTVRVDPMPVGFRQPFESLDCGERD